MNQQATHSAISFIRETLNMVAFQMDLEVRNDRVIDDRTMSIDAMASEMRGAARYVWTLDDSAGAAVALVTAATYLETVKKLSGNADAILELEANIMSLIVPPYQGLADDADNCDPFAI